MKFIRIPFLLGFFIFAISCSSSNQDADRIENLYGKYITDCIDVGGGTVNQLFASISKESQTLSIALLTWSNSNCTGSYRLTDFDGNVIAKPKAESEFSYLDVSDIPENFSVLKTVSVGDGEIKYSIFHREGTHLDVLSEYPETTGHKTWAEWLEEPKVSAFVDAPTTYNATGDYSSLHFNETDALPNALEPLFGNWISDCVDFGGGPRVQIYVSFNEEEVKSATLAWTVDGCTGTYTMTDTNENPVTEPTVSQKISAQYISGIQEDYFIIKVSQVSDPSAITYAVINVGTNEFYQIVPYSTSLGSTWADWLTDADVLDFAADAAASSPMTHIKFHFTAGDLP